MYTSKSEYKKPKIKNQFPKVETDSPKKKPQVRIPESKLFDTISTKSKEKK